MYKRPCKRPCFSLPPMVRYSQCESVKASSAPYSVKREHTCTAASLPWSHRTLLAPNDSSTGSNRLALVSCPPDRRVEQVHSRLGVMVRRSTVAAGSTGSANKDRPAGSSATGPNPHRREERSPRNHQICGHFPCLHVRWGCKCCNPPQNSRHSAHVCCMSMATTATTGLRKRRRRRGRQRQRQRRGQRRRK